jgi:outer membrane cobalamin receptor
MQHLPSRTSADGLAGNGGNPGRNSRLTFRGPNAKQFFVMMDGYRRAVHRGNRFSASDGVFVAQPER